MAKRKATGKIERQGLQDIIDPMLAAEKTYEQIIAEVLKQKGVTLNDSNLSRYRQRWESAKARMEAAIHDAEIIEKIVRDHPGSDLGGAAMGLMLSKIYQRFAEANEGFEEADLQELGTLLVKIQRTSQMKESIEIQRDRLELFKQRAVSAAGKVKDALAGANVDPAEATKLVDAILGVTA